MSIVVFWINLVNGVDHIKYDDDQLSDALSLCEKLRKAGRTHVTISSELSNSVGKPGVTSIVDGKTPDGLEYDWRKRR
jgi:hypothetical protein